MLVWQLEQSSGDFVGNMAFRDFGSTELCEHEVLAAGKGENIEE